jgi:hypothetical protein
MPYQTLIGSTLHGVAVGDIDFTLTQKDLHPKCIPAYFFEASSSASKAIFRTEFLRRKRRFHFRPHIAYVCSEC